MITVNYATTCDTHDVLALPNYSKVTLHSYQPVAQSPIHEITIEALRITVARDHIQMHGDVDYCIM